MKAAVYKGNKQFEVEEIPTPTPGLDEVVIRVKYCAICGTDVHCFLYDVSPPGTVMGHEYCGIVTDVGSMESPWNVGDRVVGGGGISPIGRIVRKTEARDKNHPRENFRERASKIKSVGAYAEYKLLESWEPLPIPDKVTDEMASLCEPIAVAVHAIRLSRIKLGDHVVVLGAGPIGLFCLQVAKAAGANSVIVSEPAVARSRVARSLGANEVLDPTVQDIESEIVKLTDGKGPDVVLDCAGLGSTLNQAFNLVRRGGQVVLVAVPWESVPILPADWMAREVAFQTSFGSIPEDWNIALKLLESGAVDVSPMLPESAFIPLEGIQDAFEALTKPTSQIQMVIRP